MSDTGDNHYLPGGYVLRLRRCQAGYYLNQFLLSLAVRQNRDAFFADELGYLGKFPMTAAQRRAVLERNWLAMVALGASFYYSLRLAEFDARADGKAAAECAVRTHRRRADRLLGTGGMVFNNEIHQHLGA